MPDALYLTRKIYYVNPEESLSGFVQKKPASDIEERTALSLSRLEIPFMFQARINPLAGLTEEKQNLPGEVEIDFLTEYMGRLYPLNIQGEISHFFAAWQKDRDVKKKVRIDSALQAYEAHPLILVPFTKLRTQDDSDRFYRFGFLNGWPTEFYEE